MTQEHPITPPPELLQQWVNALAPKGMMAIATQAARWGADQELEACCEFEATVYSTDCADKLRRHRRPKPPSLKEQALEALNKIEDNKATYLESSIIRRALEQLND